MERKTERTDEYKAGLVSVVIPTYGRNETLPRAIESVVNQTYDEIELIVVDDGSPVPVTETISELGLDRLTSVTFVRHHKNRGANVARNSGINSATGEYIAFLDDDDQWCETKISRQINTFKNASSNVGVVYTGVRANSPTGTTVSVPTAEGNIVKYLLTGGSLGQFSSVMVRHEVVDAVGLPDERFPAWQDREWFFRLAREYHFKPVLEPLTIRETRRPDSITKKFEEKRDVAYPLFVEKHYQFAKEHGRYYARMFLASMRATLAHSAVIADEYGQARRYFLLAFIANPFYYSMYPYLIACLGRERTYKLASWLWTRINILRPSTDK